MAQTRALLKALKKVLKAHGLTYVHVAKHLGLTEASIKRLFSEESLSLQRLDQICQLVNIEISDLVQQMGEQHSRLQQLTITQEEEIINDLTLLLVAVCILNKWSMNDIISQYQIEETECIQKLAKLDKLKIIELLPQNKVKLLVAPNFSWIENGPIQLFFQKTIGREYFNSKFDREQDCLIVLNGMLSPQSSGEFQRKLKRLARDFDMLNNDDVALPISKRNGVTVVMGIRGWRYGLFKHLQR